MLINIESFTGHNLRYAKMSLCNASIVVNAVRMSVALARLKSSWLRWQKVNTRVIGKCMQQNKLQTTESHPDSLATQVMIEKFHFTTKHFHK